MSTTDTEAAGDWKDAANYLAKRAEEAQAPTNADGVIDPTKAQVGFDPTPAPKLADKLDDPRDKMYIDKLDAMVRAINPPSRLDAPESIKAWAPYGRPAYELEAEQIAARESPFGVTAKPAAGIEIPMPAAIAHAPSSYPTTEPDTAPIPPRTLWSGLDRVHDYSDEMDTALARVRAQIEQFKVLKEQLHQELDSTT